MTEKRFTLAYEKGNWWAVKDGDITLWKEETIALLNSLNEENEQLKKDVKYFNETYSVQEYGLDIETHVQLSSPIPSRKELLKENEQLKQSNEYLQEQLEDYSGVEVDSIELREENEKLKQQLFYDGDGVCDICKHEYLTPSGDYFISNCRKGHEECSKEDLKYCKDFEVKELRE